MYKSRVGLSASVTSYFTLAVRLGGLAPTLSLDFLSGSLDSRITFSRGSNATLVDSTGKVTYAPNNLLLRSEEFDNAAWTKSNATVTANASTAPDGTTTADAFIENTTASVTHDLAQAQSVTAGTIYTSSVYIKAIGSRTAMLILSGAFTESRTWFNLSTLTATTTVGSIISSSITSLGNGWFRCSITQAAATTGSGTVSYRLWNGTTASYTGDGTSGIYIWGAQLEAVTYQTTPGTYNATTASAYYGPRFDYDPVTLNPKGLLIEEQRTNLLLRSEEFDNASWIKAGATVTANATTSPDGTVDADRLVEDTSSGGHYVSAITSVTSGTAYTISAYVKASGRSWVRITFGAGFTTTSTWFDIANGTVGTVGATSATIQNVGNGWYRVTATQSATSSTSGQFFITMETSGSGTSYTGDGTSGMYLWGAQLEAGAFATSYIPTVASTVTRSADVATMTGTNFSSWYNQSEGTFAVEADTTQAAANRILEASSGTGSRVVDLNVAAGAVLQMYNGTTAFNAAGTITLNAPFKAVGAYKTANYAAVLNGGTVAVNSDALVNAANALQIGRFNAGSNYLNGHIRRIAYYPTRLANATLQRLTA